MEEKIRELEYKVQKLHDEVHGLQIMIEGHDEELSIVDARLNDLEEFVERMRWVISNQVDESPYQK